MPLTPAELYEAACLAEAGQPIREIAEKLGKPYSAVYRPLHAAGLTRSQAKSLASRRANKRSAARSCLCEGRCECHRVRHLALHLDRSDPLASPCRRWDSTRPAESCVCPCHDAAREVLALRAEKAAASFSTPAAPQLPELQQRRSRTLLDVTLQALAEKTARESENGGTPAT